MIKTNNSEHFCITTWLAVAYLEINIAINFKFLCKVLSLHYHQILMDKVFATYYLILTNIVVEKMAIT